MRRSRQLVDAHLVFELGGLEHGPRKRAYPAQAYCEVVGGENGVLAALVTDGSSARGPDSTMMTTVGTASDIELCPDCAGHSIVWTIIEDGES
jgi:hypothetical protein